MRDERAAVRTELEPEHQPDAAHAVKQMVVVRDELFERTAKALAGRLDRREEAFLQHDVEHRLSRGAGERVAAIGRTMGADHHAARRLFGREARAHRERSEEHTSELQSLMRISYDVFCLNKKKNNQ